MFFEKKFRGQAWFQRETGNNRISLMLNPGGKVGPGVERFLKIYQAVRQVADNLRSEDKILIDQFTVDEKPSGCIKRELTIRKGKVCGGKLSATN